MSGIEVSASYKGKIGCTGSPQVGGDLSIDQSKHKNVNVTYEPPIQHDGVIGAFNFDLQRLQSEEVIAKRVDELEKIRHVNDADSNDPVEITYKPLRQIWTKTLDDLANRPQNLTVQLAERILEVLAFLSPTGVPERWFRTLLQSFLDSNEISLTQDMNADAKRLLASVSLVEISDGKLVIHRLLQTTLLSRINAAPHLKFESLHWLLPSIAKLYSSLRAEKTLQNFNSNMHHLFINISADLLENMPNLAVSFLVQFNRPGMEFCQKLLKRLIRSVFEERVIVSRESLNLLVTSPQVVDSVILLPMWIRECGENVPVGEQLGLVKKILNLKATGWRTAYPFDFDVDGAGKIYLAIAEVLAKWEPEVTDNKDNFEVAQDALSLVKRLCKTLSKAMKSKQLCFKSYYRNLNLMFSKLKKCLVTALTVIFSQRVTKSQIVEAMFDSVLVSVRWYLTLEEFESGFETKLSKTLNINQLDDILAQTGVDRSIGESYEALLQCCYSILNKYAWDRKKRIQLEARVAGSFSAILDKCASDGQQNEINRSTSTVAELHLQEGSYVPLEVIPLWVALSNWEQFWSEKFSEYPILKSYLLCKGLEPHLQTLKTNYQIDDRDRCQTNFRTSLATSFTIIVNRYCHYKFDGTVKPSFKQFIEDRSMNSMETSPQTVPIRFPWRECANVVDNILERKKPMKSTLERLSLSIEDCEDWSNPRELVETFEEYCVVKTGSERFKLFEILRKASMLIGDNTPWTCDCLVSRCQRMLAGLSLEEGNVEDAISVASEAFEHQLYCAASYSNLVQTVQVLLDAYSKYEDAITRSKKLLHRIIAEHEGWIDCEPRFRARRRVQPTLLSQSRLMRYLCSVGSLQAAADVGENFGFGLPQSFSDKFGRNILDLDGLLIVALFLILSGDSDQAMRTLECDHLNHKFTDQDYHRYRYFDNDSTASIEVVSNERSSFLLALKQIAASISSDSELPSEFKIEGFRKGVFAYAEIDQDEDVIRDWLAEKQHWTDWFKTTKRDKWRKKFFGHVRRYQQMLALLWFDTMETLLFQNRELLDRTLFTTLERHLELNSTGTNFKLTDSTSDWGMKCLVRMYRRQELWFQKSEVYRGLVDQAEGEAEEWTIIIGSSTLIKRGMPDPESSKSLFQSLQVSLGFSGRK